MGKMKQERPSTSRRKSGMRIEVPASNNLENRIAVSNDVKVLLVDENSIRGQKYQLLTCTFCACRIADLPISAGYCRYRIGKSKVLPIISAIGNRQFRGLPISYRRRYRTGKIGKSANRQQPQFLFRTYFIYARIMYTYIRQLDAYYTRQTSHTQ